ncbi:hypothetical protein Emed_007352 [Eimeria media]
MRPKDLPLTRWLQRQRPLLLLLLLLLAAAAPRGGLCSAYEGEEANSEAAHADASVQEEPSPSTGAAAGAAAAAAAEDDVAAEDVLPAAAPAAAAAAGEEEEEVGAEGMEGAPSLPRATEASVHRNTSSGRRWLQPPLPAALGGAVLGLLLLFVIASERRLAGARAMLAQTSGDAAHGAGEQALVQGALQREDLAVQVLQQQLEQSQQERRAAMTTLSGLAKKRAELSSRLVLLRGSSAKQVSANDIEAARDRVQRALEAKEDALRELEQQRLLSSLTEETAEVFLWHLNDDREAVEAETEMVGRCTEGLKKSESLDQATITKRGELEALKQALAKSREELELLEAEEAEVASAAAAAGAAGAGVSELAAMRKSFAKQRRSMILRAEEEEENLKDELARLRKAPAFYSKAFERMQAVEADLKQLVIEMEGFTAAAEARVKAVEKEKEEESSSLAQLETLSPEEKALYEARVRQLQLKLEKQTLEAQSVILTSAPEKAEYLRASRDLLKLTGTSKPPTPSGATKADAQERSRQISAAAKRTATARQALEDKEHVIINVKDRLRVISDELRMADIRVERRERKVKALEQRGEMLLASPQAFGIGELEKLSNELGNYEMGFKELSSMARNYSLEAYEDVPEEERERFWANRVEAFAAEGLHMLHELFDRGNKLMLAVERAQDELQQRMLFNEIQAVPLAQLAAHAAQGAESSLLQQHLEKRWDAVQKEIATRQSVLQTSVNHMRMMRRALEDIAVSGYWSDELGPLKTKAFFFLAREEARQEFCKQRVDYLKTITKEKLQKDLEKLFSEAAWDLKEMLAQYGPEASTAQTFRAARTLACNEYAQRLKEFKTVITKQALQLAPVVHFQELPAVEIPERSERRPGRHKPSDDSVPKTDFQDLGHLEGYTVPRVMQLRKK